MAKIIAIWGNPGSGKTTFACLLAKRLTRDKSKAIIVSPDSATPILPVLFPNENIEKSMSLGNVLSAVEIDNALVASKVVLYKPYPFVGVMGYSAGETPLSYPDTDYAKVLEFIFAASSLVDYLILDCTSSVVSAFTPAALEAADTVIGILAPNLFGIHYFRAHQPLLADPRFKLDEQITLAGKARPFQAIEEMGHLIGGFDGYLPYNKEIERSATCGELFTILNNCGQKYTAALETVVKAVSPEQPDASKGKEKEGSKQNDEQFE